MEIEEDDLEKKQAEILKSIFHNKTRKKPATSVVGRNA